MLIPLAVTSVGCGAKLHVRVTTRAHNLVNYQNSNSGAFGSNFSGFFGETDPLVVEADVAPAEVDAAPAALADVAERGDSENNEAPVVAIADASDVGTVLPAPEPASCAAAELLAIAPFPCSREAHVDLAAGRDAGADDA